MFERHSIPAPFQVGQVNAYLAGRTVVDPGPDGEDALAALEDALAARDLRVDDLEQVLVTHPHPDHFGLANRLQDHGADVLASESAATILRDFERRLEHEQTYFGALFEAHGMAPETVQTVTQLPEAFVDFAPSVAVDRELTEGDVVAVDGTDLTVRDAVGHSESGIAFEWREDGDGAGHDGGAGAGDDTGDRFSAIVGDEVLPDTTPNPFLQPPELPDGPIVVPEHDGPAELDDLRRRSLPAFNRSLEEFRAAGHDRFLPGHGAIIEDPQARIEEILAAHEERSEAVLGIVDGPTTAVDVMRGLFPDLPVIEYFPGMSEAIGHLDVLVERGEVVLDVQDGTLVYRRA